MKRSSSVLIRYAAAVPLTAAALCLRWILDPALGDSQPLSLLFGAVALAVWWSGYGPALLVTGLGYLASDYLFIPPRGVFAIIDIEEWVSLLTYLISCGVIIGFGEGLRRARHRAQEYARDLEQQKAQLERVERHKDRFLATLAHELRNPLAPILNAARVLQLSAADKPELRSTHDIIERQVRHIVRLVNDLLDLSRIGSGRLHLQMETIELNSVFASAVEMTRPQIDAAGHDLSTSLPLEPLRLHGDPTRLAQVFANLLTNAARYTPRGGRISLDVRCADACAIVSVRDTGVGIPQEMLPRIFEIYMQLDRENERTQGGLGIGLWLVRKLLDLHGASIEARSEGPCKGSEFIVRLPLLAGEDDPSRPQAIA